MKMTNRHSIKSALLAMSIGLILLSGCETFNHSKKSREVTFGARIYSGLATKTAYSGVTVTEGEEPNKVTYERINWVDGDKIRIYSPEVVRRFSELNNDVEYHWADYSIVGSTIDNTVNNGRSSQAKLQPLNKDTDFSTGNGLFWSDDLVGQTASFYAVYPAPSVDDASGLVQTSDGWSPAGAKGTISCSLPGTQAFSQKGNMEYAFMTACAPNVAFEDNVDLKFYPAYTAFEFHLAIDATASVNELYFGEFKLSSTVSSLFGNYDVICNTTNPDNPAYTCPAFSDGTAGEDDSANNCINVDLNGYKLVKSGEGNTELVFTVFALPQELKNLSISFEVGPSTGSYVTRTLDFKKTENNVASWLSFKGCAKHVIKGLAMKGEMWMLQIDGLVLPWDYQVEKTTFTQNVQSGPFTISGALETTDAWMENEVYGGRYWNKLVGKMDSNDPTRGAKGSNHYESYDTGTNTEFKTYSEWVALGSGQNAYNLDHVSYYQLYYQLRTLDMSITPVQRRRFDVTFKPMAPLGGYWTLSTANAPSFGNTAQGGTEGFRIVLWDGESEITNWSSGQIMNQEVTIRIYPSDSRDPSKEYCMLIKASFSPNKNGEPTYSADSEIQDVHGDGRYSYWKFVIPATE